MKKIKITLQGGSSTTKQKRDQQAAEKLEKLLASVRVCHASDVSCVVVNLDEFNTQTHRTHRTDK